MDGVLAFCIVSAEVMELASRLKTCLQASANLSPCGCGWLTVGGLLRVPEEWPDSASPEPSALPNMKPGNGTL